MDNVVINITQVVPEVEVNICDPCGGGGGGTQDLEQVLTEGNNGGGLQIKNIADPTDAQDAATKKYVDDNAGGGSVDSVTGTADRIVITGTATDPIIDIDSAYDSAITAEIAAATLTQRYVCGTNINSSVTGTATETLISTVEMVIPANTMTANSMLTIIALFNRVSAGGITTIKWGFNTSYAIAGTVFVSNANMTAAVRGVELHFNVFTNNALNSTKWNLAVSFSSATTNSNGVTTVGTIDWSVDQYLIITTTSAVAGENTTLSAVRVYIDKA